MKLTGDLFQHLPRPCAKVGYPTKQAAKVALRQVISTRRQQGSERCEDHAYHCPHCGRFHLTSMTHDTFHTLTRRLGPQHGLRLTTGVSTR
jgi:hypothetical protein